MINPNERLGAPGSKNDIKNLKNHPFFSGIDFDHLDKCDVIALLEEEDIENAKHSPKVKGSFSNANTLSSSFDENDIVCKGYLLKKNRWFKKQNRLFTLNRKGELAWYKD